MFSPPRHATQRRMHPAFAAALASEAALVTLCVTVPATQGLWLSAQFARSPAHRTSRRRWRTALLLPFSGGARHIAFQIAAWVRGPKRDHVAWHAPAGSSQCRMLH